MGLKQIQFPERINFLKKFTFELLGNSAKEIKTKKKIEQEKLNQELAGKISPEEAFRKIIRSQVFEPEKTSFEVGNKDNLQKPAEIKKEEVMINKPKEPVDLKTMLRKPFNHRLFVPKQTITQKKYSEMPAKAPLIQKKTQQVSSISGMQPSLEVSSEDASLKSTMRKIKPDIPKLPQVPGYAIVKIGALIRDPSIQSIECTGPEKNILVKRYGKINATKIMLSREDISDIIESFSKKTRIPVVGGILKAAVDNMVISAVTSDFIGSRFIINKITPYSLLHEEF